MARPHLEHRDAWRDVADAIAARLARPPRNAVRIQGLARAAPGALGAVDGGSAVVLEGGGLAAGAVRAAALLWREHAPAHEAPAALELRLLDGALAEELDARLPGLPPAEGPARLLERLRALREWEAAMALAPRLREGDVLAVDGSLAQPDWPARLASDLARACAAQGAALVGVCKSTRLALDGTPALLAAARAARGAPEPWMGALPPVQGVASFAVRLAPGARVFKVELPEGTDAAPVLGRLAAWALDAGYPGYPYPLALAHNRCALDEALVQDLAHALRARAAERGVDEAAWEEVFGDFHDVLDRGL